MSRDVKEPYNEVIEMINDAGGLVVSVDIPSGINADTGAVMNCAVRADATVTFGYNKIGIMLYPGKEYAGDITVADIGFCPQALSGLNPARYFTPEDMYKIPERDAHSNKGTYGRTVVIAGNARMSGAAYLAAEASYRSGSGLVEIVTHNNNTAVLKELIPEAIVDGYDNNDAVDVVKNAADRASRIIIGPGLGTDETARNIVYKVIDSAECPLIMDADALNIIADDISLLKKCKSTVIITPHIAILATSFALVLGMVSAIISILLSLIKSAISSIGIILAPRQSLPISSGLQSNIPLTTNPLFSKLA